ncbi:MAG: SDR family NAD(P)-dependent oxidoreductase [Actinomycetota bacterium]
MQLRGRNALLTGAAGGLGHYIARSLADEGVNLVLSDLPELEPELEPLVAELRQRGIVVETVPADLSDAEQAERLIAAAEEALAALDILVNNAGLEFGGGFMQRTPAELELIAQVNLTAVMLTTRAALPGMLERGGGHVVNLASIAGKTAPPFLASYVATKHAVVGFTHSLRAELGEEGIGFSAICPTFISRVGMYGRLEDKVSDPPPGLATLPPERVGAAVVKAIREDRAEIVVASPLVRPLILLSAMAPRLTTQLFRNKRMREFAEDFSRAKEASPKTAGEKRAVTETRD